MQRRQYDHNKTKGTPTIVEETTTATAITTTTTLAVKTTRKTIRTQRRITYAVIDHIDISGALVSAHRGIDIVPKECGEFGPLSDTVEAGVGNTLAGIARQKLQESELDALRLVGELAGGQSKAALGTLSVVAMNWAWKNLLRYYIHYIATT